MVRDPDGGVPVDACGHHWEPFGRDRVCRQCRCVNLLALPPEEPLYLIDY